MRYWLVKSPFRSRTWAKVLAAGGYRLYGIRNAQARQAIGQMQPGDEALFYFQQTVWGVMRVTDGPVADPTDAGGNWLAIAFSPTRTIEPPVPLAVLKMNPAFQDSSLLRQPRLSIMLLTEEQWQVLVFEG